MKVSKDSVFMRDRAHGSFIYNVSGICFADEALGRRWCAQQSNPDPCLVDAFLYD